MSFSETDPVSLDEKIARIKKKNEMIIKRKQLIEKEIELAKKHNAMVDLNAPKIIDEDDRPTLYSDTIPESHREKSRGSNPNKVNYKPRNNTREEADWRAERNEIDRERIRRQRADSGWKREWDADKCVPEDEFHRDSSFDKRSHSKEIPQTRPSHYYQSVSVERSQLPPRQNQCRGDQSISVERSQLPPRPNQCRGRGRPIVRADIQTTQSGSNQNFNITQNLRRTVSVEPQNLRQEKVPLRKRVSWDNENELIESPRISLKDDHLKNIKVKVNTGDTNVRNRSIEITEERGCLDKSQNLSKFDDKTGFNIKDCVSKAAPHKSRVNQYAIKDTIPPPKPKESSTVKIDSNPIIKDGNRFRKPTPNDAHSIPPAISPPNDEVDADDDEWEDLSGEDWESASYEE